MRNNYSCLWSSSYDRGIQYLLDMWPDIKKAVPEAELNITYGWNLFDSLLGDNPERMYWKQEMDKKMNQPGIKHLGRIGQEEMNTLLKETGLWVYPTEFQEISCISAMKAQIYGAIPVTMNYCALKETVNYGSKINGDIAETKVQEVFKKEWIAWLKDPERQKETRKVMMENSKKEFSWSGIAKEWIEEFDKPRVVSKNKESKFKDYVFEEVVKDGKKV